MAKKRRASAYRKLERPYTRVSKYRKRNYTRGNPHMTLNQFEMGKKSGVFSAEVGLVVQEGVQIRDIALSAARMATNRRLEKKIGKENYHFKIRVFPHHILRENPLASGAGADRMSTGMKKSFGKTIGRSAQARKGATIFTVRLNPEHIPVAREALTLAGHKFPVTCKVKVVKDGKPKVAKKAAKKVAA